MMMSAVIVDIGAVGMEIMAMLMAAADDRPPFYCTTGIRKAISQCSTSSDFRARERFSPLPSLSRYHVTRKSRNGARRSIWHCELFDGLSSSVRLSCLFPRAAAVVFLFEWPDELQYPIGLKLRPKWNKCSYVGGGL